MFHREFNQSLIEKFAFGPVIKPSFDKIHKAFEDQVRKNPELIAAENGDKQISYRDLDGQSKALSSHLIEMGSKPGDNIGVFLERSIPMLVSILGILKSGSAYVPQDARITPTTQLTHIVEKAKIKIILTLSHLKHRIPVANGVRVIEIDSFLKDIGNKTMPQLENRRNPLGTCFVLFTSGTTGLPNGVKVSHKNLCNILLTSPGNLGVRPKDKVSQILNISFDMAAWEIFTALSHGATLHIRGKSIAEAIAKVDIVIATPSILADIDPRKNKHVKVVAVAGEPCPKELADNWSKNSDFYNCCGPTETTIVNTMKLYEMNESKITIGKPTPNNSVYILDEKLNPLPIGEIGEMWAGGDCVTQGYINNKKLTKERYKADPFLGEGNLMFRTRDLGRWTIDGELEHFGRTDGQVKIKGFRVELDSISTVLEKVAHCRQAITLKLDNQNLVSFVTPNRISLKATNRALMAILPYYCIPSFIIPMDKFPKTDRGKIDKKTLTVLAVKIQEEANRREQEVSA
ncbi:MAG: amino acid adenylation domain-containing protein [Bacteriovoracaceae bacterium]|jgi:D-alanine--poly(phosphoribitol) ligase subunit 1|nr:amino acid adenylation domain-containing protein [Bacteriovoracaceae bacterium]